MNPFKLTSSHSNNDELFDPNRYLQPPLNKKPQEDFQELRENLLLFGKHLLPSRDAYPVRLNQALFDITLGNPGKLLRPTLAVACAHELGGDVLTAYRYGWAVELLHISSLILDDLPSMDDADTRRGRKTIHVTQGEGFAILLSSYAHNMAMQLISSQTEKEKTALKFIDAVYKALGGVGLIGGQVLDLEFRKKNPLLQYADAYRIKLGIKDLLTLCNLFKTAPLFRLAVYAGVITSNNSDDVIDDLCQCGDLVGMIFQLLDDEEDDDIVVQQGNFTIQIETTKEELLEESLFHQQEIKRILQRHLKENHTKLFDYFSFVTPDISSEISS